MALAAAVTLVLDTAQEAFNLLLSIGAGTGLLYLLRWVWSRINAWSEIAAMASSFVLAAVLFFANRNGAGLSGPAVLVTTVAVTTVVWLAATLLTPGVDRETLRGFYRRVRPAGPGWRDIRHECGDLAPAANLRAAFIGWASGCAFVYAVLFGTGHFLLGHRELGAVFLGGALVAGWQLLRSLRFATEE
jgi:hypothetical protein